MLGRPREFEPQDILRKAMLLFWEKGYGDTSMQDLVKHTGLNRASLYKTFGGKEELFQHVVDHYVERVGSHLMGSFRGHVGLDGIDAYFDAVGTALGSRAGTFGCLVVNSGMEFGQVDAGTTKRVQAYRLRLKQSFRECLREAQSQGQLRAVDDVEDCIEYLLALAQGIFATARMRGSSKELRGAVRGAKTQVKMWRQS